MTNSNHWHYEGRRLQIAGQGEEAIVAYKEALRLKPNRLDSRNNLAILLRDKGLKKESTRLLEMGVLTASEQWEKCKDIKEKEVIATNWAHLLNSCSVQALQDSQYEKCCSIARQQVQLDPHGCGYVNLGVALEGLNRPSEAAKSHLIGLQRHDLKWKNPEELVGKPLHNSSASSQLHRELTNLATCRLQESPLVVRNWELLLSRLGVEDKIWSLEELPWEKLWQGKKCDSLLIWDEQGFGDALQCLRWVDACRLHSKQLTLMLRPTLLNLVKKRLTVPENCVIVPLPESGPPLTEYEQHCPLMGLPVALASNKLEIPTPKPPKDHWLKSRYKPSRERRIGLVWAAGQKNGRDAQRASNRRSISGKRLIKHALTWKKLWNAQIISLQQNRQDPSTDELIRKEAIDRLDEGGDWESTAKVVEKLDLVVSVDTAMVHLAGNLGVPCLVLLNQVHDWRWGTQEASLDWYANQTMLRCKTNDDWERLLEEADLVVEAMINR